MFYSRNCFSQNICDHIICRYIFYIDSLITNFFFNKMIFYINVLWSWMKFAIFRQKNCALFLSHIIFISVNYLFLSFNNWFNHNASFIDVVKALYSASVKDNDTVFCFALFHVIMQLFNLNTYPDVDFRSSIDSA